MPQGNVKAPAKKSGATAVAVMIKKAPAKTKRDSPAPAPSVEKKPAKRATVKKTSAKAAKGDGQTSITPEQRYRMICDAAYFRAERRGFVGGNPHEDWLAAEAEIDAMLKSMTH